MKKIWLLLLFCLASQARSDAQIIISLLFGDKLNSDKILFGLHANYTGSHLTNLEGAENLGGFKLALLFNFKLSDRFNLQSELVPPMWFGTKGIKPYSLGDAELDNQFKDGEVERRIWLTGLTALGQYRVYDYIRLEAGPEIFLRFKAKDTFKAEPEAGELSLERDIKDETSTFEVGLALGVSYHLQKGTGMMFGLRYYWGLTDVMKNEAASQQFRMWQITSGIPIGRKKSTENAKPAEKTRG
jgi:hypothetical protein